MVSGKVEMRVGEMVGEWAVKMAVWMVNLSVVQKVSLKAVQKVDLMVILLDVLMVEELERKKAAMMGCSEVASKVDLMEMSMDAPKGTRTVERW